MILIFNGKLAIEFNDPDPLGPTRYTKVAFTACASWVRIRKIVIRKIEWKRLKKKYISKF